jgi:hypothetical protein
VIEESDWLRLGGAVVETEVENRLGIMVGDSSEGVTTVEVDIAGSKLFVDVEAEKPEVEMTCVEDNVTPEAEVNRSQTCRLTTNRRQNCIYAGLVNGACAGVQNTRIKFGDIGANAGYQICILKTRSKAR